MPILQKEGNRVEDHKHEFVGAADGVHCTRCGLHLTPEQYRAYMKHGTGETAEKRPARRGRKKVESCE